MEGLFQLAPTKYLPGFISRFQDVNVIEII